MEDNNEVCAPGVNFLGGSCISLELLEDMISIYNSEHDDKMDMKQYEHMKKLNPVTYKKKLVGLMENKMKNYKCDTHTCWLTLPFFKKLSSDKNTQKLHKHTFRPHGPKNTTEWLNNYNIGDVFEQYEIYYPNFKFMGALPRDFDDYTFLGIKDLDFQKLQNSGKTKLGFVFNLDKRGESGSHWVSMFSDLDIGCIYFIDSVGNPPALEFVNLMERIKLYLEKNNKNVDMRYNETHHQHGNSECGVYSISFILRLLDGETFDEITQTKVSDAEIKVCRRSYFR